MTQHCVDRSHDEAKATESRTLVVVFIITIITFLEGHLVFGDVDGGPLHLRSQMLVDLGASLCCDPREVSFPVIEELHTSCGKPICL